MNIKKLKRADLKALASIGMLTVMRDLEESQNRLLSKAKKLGLNLDTSSLAVTTDGLATLDSIELERRKPGRPRKTDNGVTNKPLHHTQTPEWKAKASEAQKRSWRKRKRATPATAKS